VLRRFWGNETKIKILAAKRLWGHLRHAVPFFLKGSIQ
jgi:hypothetical protein